MRSLYQNFT